MKKKLVFTLLVIMLFMVCLSTNEIVQAVSLSNIIGGAEDFVNSGQANSENALNTQILTDTSNLIYNTFLIVGICAAVIVGAILGIQFITGSVEQKVKVKESLIPFIIGCVVIFGAFGIWRLVIVLLRYHIDFKIVF